MGKLPDCLTFRRIDIMVTKPQEYPFAVMYFETKDKRIYSLRSQGENGVDVSMIASKFGGGGHRNVAGFSIEKPQIDLNQYI